MSTILAPAQPIHQHQPLTKKATGYRVNSIDLLRGLVMIIMALDHTRDFFHKGALNDDPLNFATTTPILFFTRWITHFCAPVFVFLAGASIYLQSLRKSKKELSLFILKRGLWLILVEVTLVSFALFFDPHFSFFGLQTIWAIGISMVFMSIVIWMPFIAILVAGAAIVLGHNLLDFYEAGKTSFGTMYSFLHHPGGFQVFGNHTVIILYPFLSWVGLMMVGYCFGRLFTKYEGAARTKMLYQLGAAVILFFIALRALNVYGDPSRWSTQGSSTFTFLSFINATKYPPSLLYMCMTIGPALLFLGATEHARGRLTNIITVYGRVPFFYYILHFYILHLISAAFFLARGHSFTEGITGLPGLPFKFALPGEGYSLKIVYLVWIGVVVILYPLCRWFDQYKRTHRHWWVSYL